MNFLLIFLICSTTFAFAEEKEEPTADLEAAEANGKLEIIKQIKKVNDDGSYTIGYEADDGSFKIESRDVLGNIKGTYGYIDDSGSIKRVSYSTSNTTELAPSTPEPPSVVQRIPAKLNRTIISTTGRPIIYTTQSTPTTTSVIQNIPRRRIILENTTERYAQFIKEALAASKATPTTTAIYETSTPVRILASSKPLLRSSTQNPPVKLEGQLPRPESTLKPTDMPLYRRLPIKTTLLDEETKPVTEDSESVRGNLLRRQLPQEKSLFDPHQHVVNIQQASGGDAVDVYSASLTTGSPRPLFTTIRSRLASSTVPPVIHRPTVRYQRLRAPAEYTQESSTTETSVTPSPVPVVQIPPNNEESHRQQFVELRHPFHRGAILVPVNAPQQDYQDPVYVRRVPKFRPIPVHVDENGYIRDFQPPTTPPPVRPNYVSQDDIINEVDRIRPPVSTRDFQKLLEQLIDRQSRLEKINAITRQQQYFAGRQQQQYHPQDIYHQQGPVQFVPRGRQQEQYGPVTYTPQPTQQHSYPTKRMARLHHEEDEYLPAPVREMLLLRMLQLAINPSVPLEMADDNLESATTQEPRKDAVRNVEILGEVDEQQKQLGRTKRYKEIELDYYD